MKKNRIMALSAALAFAAVLGGCADMGSKRSWGTDSAPAKDRADLSGADMQVVLDALTALGAKPIETLTVAQARTQPSPADAVNSVKKARGMLTAPEAEAIVQNLTYQTGGTTQPIRVYKSVNAVGGDLPVVVYYHGGGWVIADLDVYDATPRSMARYLKAITTRDGALVIL